MVKKKVIKTKMRCSPSNCGGGIYFLGFLGAVIYYIQNATGFWMGVIGFLKALVWPVFVIYKLLGM